MTERMIAITAIRAKMWQEFVAQYQAKMVMEPESFSQWCEDFRSRFLAAGQ